MMDVERDNRKLRMQAVLMLLATGVLWSIGGVVIKTSDVHPMAFSSVRCGVAAAVFFVALKGKPQFTFSRPQVIGAATYATTLTIFCVATTITSAANAILLQYTSPVYVAIIAFFVLHERIHWYDIAAIGGVLIGMWLLMSNAYEVNSPVGNALAVVGGICFAVMAVALRMQKDGSPYETVLLGNIIGCIAGLPFLFLHPPAAPALLPVVFLGVCQIGGPYLLYTKASKNAKAIDLAVLPALEPVLNPIWVFLATGENPGPRVVIGGAILLGVVVLKSIIKERD
ncbi:MAG: DMT family transporter [Clostridiales Family XIII bacterium]|jgi:drug/metabolite transporter (DMT)-like permease|nr:DMT family transporter [Clostridiales Family XIII bacterium]